MECVILVSFVVVGVLVLLSVLELAVLVWVPISVVRVSLLSALVSMIPLVPVSVLALDVLL